MPLDGIAALVTAAIFFFERVDDDGRVAVGAVDDVVHVLEFAEAAEAAFAPAASGAAPTASSAVGCVVSFVSSDLHEIFCDSQLDVLTKVKHAKGIRSKLSSSLEKSHCVQIPI